MPIPDQMHGARLPESGPRHRQACSRRRCARGGRASCAIGTLVRQLRRRRRTAFRFTTCGGRAESESKHELAPRPRQHHATRRFSMEVGCARWWRHSLLLETAQSVFSVTESGNVFGATIRHFRCRVRLVSRSCTWRHRYDKIERWQR